MRPTLECRTQNGGQIEQLAERHWRFSLPAGEAGTYRLAQLDDYGDRSRSALPWTPPVRLELRARVSAQTLPGTWGFGWWNDPFAASLGLGGTVRRLPALPNAAWFFYASPPNYLAFRDTHPAQGLLAATFAALRIPPLLLVLGAPFLPLLFWSPTAQLLRRLARLAVDEDAVGLEIDPTQWHAYTLLWEETGVRAFVDDQLRFVTSVAPHGPLGLVLWIDNQYAALPSDGRLRWGTLANPAAWLELAEIQVRRP